MTDERMNVRTEPTEHAELADTEVMHSDNRGSASPTQPANTEKMEPLFSPDECRGLHSRWDALQAAFVDEPKRSVEQADSLVNEALSSLTRNFTNERQKMDQQWHRGQDVSTEDLRLAFRRYRSFFERLLTM
jgi:hypothetical protein